MERKNRGVAARIEQDLHVKEQEATDYKRKLEAKSQLYQNLGTVPLNTAVADMLVDRESRDDYRKEVLG